MDLNSLDFDRDLIERCQTNAPRYTSYPTADRFNLEFGVNEQLCQIKQVLDGELTQAISLYIHIPFCNTLCLFCACNKIITNKRSKITEYLEYLTKELALYFKLINKKLPVVQLHFGGGSPSWLSIDEVKQLMALVRRYFDLSSAREIAMELDPRHVSAEFMRTLQQEGFNRVSLGVQDFDPEVQQAVNRIQPLSDTLRVLTEANQLGFESTNIDLIYGLPLQNLTSFSRTIDLVIKRLQPARIALFNYAHLPQLVMPQTRINAADLPSASEKMDILQMAVERLAQAGYHFIGMDHFAKSEDELTRALKDKTLQRNFQGYSTFAHSHMLAFGVSAIGFVGQSYYQNTKDLPSYYAMLDAGTLPILRGISLSPDDLIRREIIQQLMCQFQLDWRELERQFAIDSLSYFAIELLELAELAALGLLKLTPEHLVVTAKGRYLIRNIAKVFDAHLRQGQNYARYSKVI